MTSHASWPSKDGTSATAPEPAGWFAHVTPDSVQVDAARWAASVRPSFAEVASIRNVAEATVVQPAARAGSGKPTRTRESEPPWDLIFSVESLPKLFVGLLSLTQLSRSAAMLSGVGEEQSPAAGGASGSSKTSTSSGGRSPLLPAVERLLRPRRSRRCLGSGTRGRRS